MSPSAADRLIASTQELLWERGYTGTSPGAIQRRARAGQGSMYHHFAGKRDLARTAIRRTADELLAAAESQLGGAGTALDRIAAYLRHGHEALRGCPVGRLAYDPDVVADPDLREPLDRALGWIRRRLGEVLAEGQEAGEIPAGLDPAGTATLIVAALQGGYVLARAADSPALLDRATGSLLDLLAGQVHARPA